MPLLSVCRRRGLAMLALCAFAAMIASADAAAIAPDRLMNDTARFWDAFRDPTNGLYCDHFPFDGTDAATNRAAALSGAPVCDGQQYSSAATGMGLVATCAFAEMGLLSKAEAEKRALQTLESLATLWPREKFNGFFVHFCNRGSPTFRATSEYSTVDTAEMAMGALFAGNYFGGAVQRAAQKIAKEVKWSVAIESAISPTIYPTVNATTGVPGGNIRPYNEYYIVAYIAKLMEETQLHAAATAGASSTYDQPGKATRYWNTYFGSQGPPVGRGGYPAKVAYQGFELLTDNPNRHFMSSFIPQFCWFLTKSFHTNKFYSQELYPAWLAADMKYWQTSLNQSSNCWEPVFGKVFGCGAGASPTGYGVNRITDTGVGSTDGVFSAAIMAGFLGATAPGSALRDDILSMLHWLYANEVCVYKKSLPPDGEAVAVLWRCSVNTPDWRAPIADSIDYSTMVLGYSLNFVPEDFYASYAA